MAIKTSLTWQENLTFEAEVDGFNFKLDSIAESNGTLQGPNPKPLLLVALSGCSGMDTVSILKKMRIPDFNLKIEVDADITDEHPKTYSNIRMNFLFTGQELPQDKIINAVELSITKYCAVYAMLSKSAQIKTTILVNNKEIWNA